MDDLAIIKEAWVAAGLERDKLQDDLNFIRDEISPFSARPCPACVYDNGKFVRRCKLHEEIDRLEVENTKLHSVSIFTLAGLNAFDHAMILIEEKSERLMCFGNEEEKARAVELHIALNKIKANYGDAD